MNEQKVELVGSTDEECYNDGPFSSIEEAVETMAEEYDLEDCDHVFVGEKNDFIPGVMVSYIIDQMTDEAHSECGECSDDWLHLVPQKDLDTLEERMNGVLHQWLKETGNEPKFYSVGKSKSYRVGDYRKQEPSK